MQWYERFVFPWLCDRAMRAERLDVLRSSVAGAATGRVLEIGIGSALNVPFYRRDAIVELIGLEPSEALAEMTRRRIAGRTMPARVIVGSAEAIPLPDASVDTVISTWTLCSIADVQGALREIRRVLAPRGSFRFAEHGLAPEAKVQRWQRRVTPAWRIAAGGCHLDRPIAECVAAAGFYIERLSTQYVGGPRVLTYMYEGIAVPESSTIDGRIADIEEPGDDHEDAIAADGA